MKAWVPAVSETPLPEFLNFDSEVLGKTKSFFLPGFQPCQTLVSLPPRKISSINFLSTDFENKSLLGIVSLGAWAASDLSWLSNTEQGMTQGIRGLVPALRGEANVPITV